MSARKKTTEEMVHKGLMDLAFGSVSDAVSLLYLSDEEVLEKLPKMKLFNISEIKRPKGGGMEIKFFDRIKACERLSAEREDGQESNLGFYQALEKSVDHMSRSSLNND